MAKGAMVAIGVPKEPPRLGAPGSRVSERNHSQETAEAEREFHREGEAPRPTPESVCFRSEQEVCGACEYFADGQCSFLQMPVAEGASCNRFESKSEDAREGVEHDAGGESFEEAEE